MALSYDTFTAAFLSKVTSFDFIDMTDEMIQSNIDGYMKRAMTECKFVSQYDFSSTINDEERQYDIDVKEEDVDEIVEIITNGMVVQWLKPYLNRQEILENVLNTRDFTTYSPAELLNRVSAAYRNAQKDFRDSIREYSYNHGDLTVLHI